MRKVLLLMFLGLAFFQFTAVTDASASTPSLQITRVVSNSSTPYNQTMRVDIVVKHETNVLPMVAVYYAPILNGTVIFGGWRAAGAQLAHSVAGFGMSVFTADIPSPIYHETFPYRTKIVFYAEAKDAFGNFALSCQEANRWNPFYQEDKVAFTLEDPYPPRMGNVTQYPESPTSGYSAIVVTNITDDLGSGVKVAKLFYSIDDGRTWIDVVMSRSKGDIYEAEIPAQKRDSKVIYYVKAYDEAGNVKGSSQTSYEVSPSLEEMREDEAKLWQTWAITAGVAFVAVVAIVLVYRRKMIETAKGMRYKALTFTMVLILLLVARASYWLYIWGHMWLALITLLAVLELWGVADPRLRSFLVDSVIKPALQTSSSIIRRLTRTFEESPPTLFIAACYIVGIVGATIVVVLYVAGAFSPNEAYGMANFFATYAFFLLAAGAVGQLIWIVHRSRGGKTEPTDM